jgi:hypothetical protein
VLRAAALESKTTQSEDHTETQSTVFYSKVGCGTLKQPRHKMTHSLKRGQSIEFPSGPRCALLCFQARLHAPQAMLPDYSSQGWIPILA